MLKCIKKSPVLYVQRNFTDARHHVGVMRYLEFQGVRLRLLKLHAPWGGWVWLTALRRRAAPKVSTLRRLPHWFRSIEIRTVVQHELAQDLGHGG